MEHKSVEIDLFGRTYMVVLNVEYGAESIGERGYVNSRGRGCTDIVHEHFPISYELVAIDDADPSEFEEADELALGAFYKLRELQD